MSKINNFFSLDISDNSIKLIECSRNFWSLFSVRSVSTQSLEKGTIVNGEIKNANALIKSFKRLINRAKPHKVISRHCILSVPENRVFTHIFSVPKALKKEEMTGFILNQAEGVMPFNRETTLTDFRIIEEGDTQVKILFVTVPKKLIEDIVGMLKRLGITVLFIELESMCMARALLNKKNTRQPAMLIDIGNQFTNIGIFDREGLKMTVSLPLAGNSMIRAIRAKLKITTMEAEAIKIKNGLNSKKTEVVKVLKNSLDKIVAECTRTTKYYLEQTGQQINKIVLTGGNALTPGLLEYFDNRFDTDIELGNPWNKIHKSKEVLKYFTKDNALFYATAIGLALRGIRNDYRSGINLLPAKEKKVKILSVSPGFKNDWPKLAALLLIIIILVGILFFKDKFFNQSNSANIKQEDSFIARTINVSIVIDKSVEVKNQLSQIPGDIIYTTGTVDVLLEKTNITDLDFFLPNTINIINNSSEEITLRANAPLTIDDKTFYLSEALRLTANSQATVVVYAEESDMDISLKIGHYNFPGLEQSQQELIYGEKLDYLAKLTPQQAAQFDVQELGQAQQNMLIKAQEQSASYLPDGLFISDPVAVELADIRYVNREGLLYLSGSFRYSWISVDKTALSQLSLGALNESDLTITDLNNAQVQLIADNINVQEKVIQAKALWKIGK